MLREKQKATANNACIECVIGGATHTSPLLNKHTKRTQHILSLLFIRSIYKLPNGAKIRYSHTQ